MKRSKKLSMIFAAKLLMVATFSSPYLHANEEIMLIFDASGSMWEQSGNKTRLDVAKGAVDQLLQEIPQNVGVGMTIYGHREKGNCGDIQVFSNSLNTEQLRSKLSNITARGKTPLGASIEKAAKSLSQNDTNARIIAMTDGLETCGYDLCELANTLKNSGVDLVVDVVAFDIAQEEDVSSLQCLTDITGGTLYRAEGFAGLSSAFETITSKSILTQSETSIESTELEHPAKAELGDQMPVTVNAKLTDGKMYMLTVVPAGSTPDTYTEGVSKMLQIGSISGNGENNFKLTLRSAVLQPGQHEVRIVDMLESRVTLSTQLELFQPGQLSDSDKLEVVQNNSSAADAGGSLIVESKDRVAANRFLDFTINVAGDAAIVSGFYTAQLVLNGTDDGAFPAGSTKTSLVINDAEKQMTMRAPAEPGDYELRIFKQNETTPATRQPVSVY